MYQNTIGKGMRFMEVMQFLAQAGVPTEQRGPLLTAAVSRAIGYCLPMPAAPVEETYAHYLATCEANVRSAVSTLNEMVALDTRAVLAAVYGIWQLRYKVCYAATSPDVREVLDAALRTGARSVGAAVSETMVTQNTAHLDHLARLICGEWQTCEVEAQPDDVLPEDEGHAE